MRAEGIPLGDFHEWDFKNILVEDYIFVGTQVK